MYILNMHICDIHATVDQWVFEKQNYTFCI